jgi:hypothetical protein
MRRQVNPDAHCRALFRYPGVAGRTAAKNGARVAADGRRGFLQVRTASSKLCRRSRSPRKISAQGGATVVAKGRGGSADVRRDRQAEQAQVAHL